MIKDFLGTGFVPTVSDFDVMAGNDLSLLLWWVTTDNDDVSAIAGDGYAG